MCVCFLRFSVSAFVDFSEYKWLITIKELFGCAILSFISLKISMPPAGQQAGGSPWGVSSHPRACEHHVKPGISVGRVLWFIMADRTPPQKTG